VNFELLAAIERDLVTREMGLHPEQHRRPPEILSPSGVVVSGFAGHLYIGDGGNQWEKQIAGAMPLSPAVVRQWSVALSSRLARAADLGVRMVHLVVPEKQIALPYFRWPTDMAPDVSNRPLFQIINAAPAGLSLVYPAGAFSLYQPWCELFWRGNSHWCATGCSIAAVLAVQALTGADASLELIQLEKVCIRHDLSAHFPEDQAFAEAIKIRQAGSRIFDNMAFAKTGHYTGSHYILRNLDAPLRESLIVFGDSCACDLGLAAALSAFFTDVHFVWSKTIRWPYVQEMQARYVLWESAERFLITPPEAD
jgi:hypothetical protein